MRMTPEELALIDTIITAAIPTLIQKCDFVGMTSALDSDIAYCSSMARNIALQVIKDRRELRQYRHNDMTEGFVFAYDKEGIDALFNAQQEPADIKKMVDRFLCWNLPADFAPDCGISFDGRKPDAWNKNKGWPIGTNLFTADQAKAMFLHCLQDAQQERPAQGEEK